MIKTVNCQHTPRVTLNGASDVDSVVDDVVDCFVVVELETLVTVDRGDVITDDTAGVVIIVVVFICT